MKKLTFLLLFVHSLLIKGQCDVAITDVNLNTYEVTVEVINSEGCLPAPIGGVSGAVTMLQIGYHLPEAIDPDNEVVDLLTLPDAPCSPQWVDNGYTLGMVSTSNFPGWWYSPPVSNTFDADLMGTNGLTTGDVVVIPLNPPGDYVTFPYPLAECGDDLIDYWLSEGECIEFVVWQLNYGSTWHVANGGWAESANGYVPNPSTYQDQNCDNSWYMCRDNNPGAAVANPDFCEDIEGCTDPLALNYNEDATIDDGSCLYSSGPDLIAIDMVITNQECLDDNQTHILYYELTVVNIGDEDVTGFCSSTFLSQNQGQCPGDINISFGDTAMFSGTFQANWVSGQGSYVELFNVVGPDDTPEIVTGNNNFVFYMPEFEECDYTDAGIEDLSIITECQNGLPRFKLNFGITNLGNDTITNYCYTYGTGTSTSTTNACVSSDGTYSNNSDIWEILPGGSPGLGSIQYITTGFITLDDWCGDVFVEVYNVNDETITNNNYLSIDLGENPCPVIPDTIYVELPQDTLTIIDTLLVTTIDTLYIELPPDTIIQIETEFVYDTTYIELPPDTVLITQIDTIIDIQTIIDTLIITNTDTLYVELPPDTITLTETEFVFVTDTIFETDIVYITDSLYITLIDTIVEYQFIEIDCSTGLPCSDLGFDECEPLVVYIPNTFTPNNDGYNDVWEIVLDPGCWTDVDAKVYNRWGDLIWESYDPFYLQWNGSNMGSSYYVPDGVYYWTFNGRKINTTVIEELQGHVTIFR